MGDFLFHNPGAKEWHRIRLSTIGGERRWKEPTNDEPRRDHWRQYKQTNLNRWENHSYFELSTQLILENDWSR